MNSCQDEAHLQYLKTDLDMLASLNGAVAKLEIYNIYNMCDAKYCCFVFIEF